MNLRNLSFSCLGKPLRLTLQACDVKGKEDKSGPENLLVEPWTGDGKSLDLKSRTFNHTQRLLTRLQSYCIYIWQYSIVLWYGNKQKNYVEILFYNKVNLQEPVYFQNNKRIWSRGELLILCVKISNKLLHTKLHYITFCGLKSWIIHWWFPKYWWRTMVEITEIFTDCAYLLILR